MAESGRSSSDTSEEYCGNWDDGGRSPSSFRSRITPPKPKTPSPLRQNTSASPSQPSRHLPWCAEKEHDLDEDAQRKLENKQSLGVKKANKICKETYAKNSKQCVKAIRKQSRNLSMLGGTNSKLTSPENDSSENPFTFHHVASTTGVKGEAGSAQKPVLPARTTHRHKRAKMRNKERSYDRDIKLLGTEYDGRGGHVVPAPGQPMFEVQTSSQFLSLASRRVEMEEEEKEKEDKSFVFRRQSLSRLQSKWPNCPRDRIKFYESFSVLIELGSKAKRKREEQLRKVPHNQAVPGAYRNELKDVLWLELQAWMHNRDVHSQDQHLMEEREKIDDILKDILEFKIEDPELSAPCFSGCDDVDYRYTNILHLAYKLVGVTLRKLEAVEYLYPCTSKIGLSHALYEKPKFQDKVKALIMWSNFYVQLSLRLQSVAGIICGKKSENLVFPRLPTSLSDDGLGDSIHELGDVLDGNGFLDGDGSRSGMSSRASSYYDISRLDDSCNESAQAVQVALRSYLEKSLRKRGLEKTVTQIKNLVFPTLRHILRNLEQPVASATGYQRQSSNPEGRMEIDVVRLWCDLHQESNLPCLDRVFIHLLRLPIRVLKEGITLRLEQKPEGEPDFASLNQLIHECKDTLVNAIQIRKDYIELGNTIKQKEVMLTDIRSLDEMMKELLALYLDYLQQWVLNLQKETKCSRLQKSLLEDEWLSMTNLCGGIDEAEMELPKMFCFIVVGLLGGIGTLLDSGLDDSISSLYQYDEGISPSKDDFRQFFRDCKAVFLEAKERCFKLLEFTKLLHKDLEIAAVYEVLVNPQNFLEALHKTDHCLVELVTSDAERKIIQKENNNYAFFASSSVCGSTEQVKKLLNATMGGREQDVDLDGYLLIAQLGQEKWEGRTMKICAGALTLIRHSHIELDPGNVMVVALKNSALNAQAKNFEKKMPKEHIKPSIPQTTCHQIISQALDDIKEESLGLAKKICSVILRFQTEINIDTFTVSEAEKHTMTKIARDLFHWIYNFAIEYHRELARLNFSDEEALAKQLVDLARQWIDFVITKCDRGHGTRPRWSTTGLDYLAMAVRPTYTRYLGDEDFVAFKNLIDKCVTHVIGDQPPPGARTPVESPTAFYLSPPQSSQALSMHRSSLSLPEGNNMLQHMTSRISSRSGDTTTSYESSEEEDTEYEQQHNQRVVEAIGKIEKKRYEKLREARSIGQIVPTESAKSLKHLTSRKVDFKWRLCGKLGSGRHADVYKVMNLNTGGLLAVKKFSFTTQSDYAERISKLAVEVEHLAGLKHPNVVQYFGVEIHRDELLLFMEYCDGGTLSTIALQGLDIIMVRVYAKQLLMGICFLHENAICHLDIKGPNVFLTAEGVVKLGDFGEIVKLPHGYTCVNDVESSTGTTRYMSPEMIRGEEGVKIGRASDIWSYGCTVLEMITGKPPKMSNSDNEAQFMCHIATGGRPRMPDDLTDDARDFLDHCWEPNPDIRWRSEKLLHHPFVTIDIGDISS